MRAWRMLFLIGLICLAPRAARADVTSSELIRDHVDEVVARLDVAALSAKQKQALLAHRLKLNLALLVPFYGSYRLDTKVYGELRPAGVLFDWVLGGAVPIGLGTWALVDDSLSSRWRTGLAWTAAGLYAATRIGILIVGNNHISVYNKAMRERLGLSAAAAPPRTWIFSTTARW